MQIEVKIKLESPIHLGSGRADVNLDAEVVHDEFGVPYFPAKRLKGLLYESAVEVAEMFDCCQSPLFSQAALEALFQRVPNSAVQLVIHNFYLPQYEQMRVGWNYLQTKYKEFITPADVLKFYTSIRYQTEIDQESGTAKEGSLHNLRVVDSGLEFVGTIELIHGTEEQQKIIVLALQNLTTAGMKRNRGLGKIACIMDKPSQALLEKMLGKE